MRFHKNIFFLFFFFFFFLFGFARQNKIDSLEKILTVSKADTNKVEILHKLFLQFEFKDKEKAAQYLNTAFDLSQKLDYKKGIATTYSYFGFLAEDTGRYSQAIIHYKKALKISEEINDKKGISSSLGIIGISYDSQGDYPNALEYYFKSLKIAEEISDSNLIATWLGNIANIYKALGEFSKALDYGFKSLHLREELGNKSHIAIQLGNIGTFYYNQGDSARNSGNFTFMKDRYDMALEYNFKSLKMREELGAKNLISATVGNIGNVYKSLAEFTLQNNKKTESDSLYKKTLEYYFRALAINEEIGKKIGIAVCMGNIGAVYSTVKKNKEAEKFLLKGIAICDSIGALNEKRQLEEIITTHYEKTNQQEKAFEHYKKYIASRDSIYNAENTKKNVRTEMNFEFEKKEAVTKAENEKQAEIAAAENKKQKIIIFSVAGGLLFVILLAGVIFRSLRITRKQKHIIEIQKDEVTRQKKEVEQQKEIVEEQKEEITHKNKELTDSINYAQRIQSAILTSEQYLNDMFLPKEQTASHFILYKPKDIVAGDFYWAYSVSTKNKGQRTKGKNEISSSLVPPSSSLAIWVTADCTGHGVPGAFMSMIGNSLLNEIVVEKGIHEPDEILNHLRAGVIKALGQGVSDDDKRKDGMDAAVCYWNKTTNKLSFAGANNCLWIVRKIQPHPKSLSDREGLSNAQVHPEYSPLSIEEGLGVRFIEIEPDIQPVGHHLIMNPFTKKEIQLEKGDTLYTFTDGYCDQFGGPKGKKFKYKPFKDLLLSIQHKTMPEQKQIINKTIEEWKGNLEQIDDICVMGVKV